jgi:hypothetical protein
MVHPAGSFRHLLSTGMFMKVYNYIRTRLCIINNVLKPFVHTVYSTVTLHGTGTTKYAYINPSLMCLHFSHKTYYFTVGTGHTTESL